MLSPHSFEHISVQPFNSYMGWKHLAAHTSVQWQQHHSCVLFSCVQHCTLNEQHGVCVQVWCGFLLHERFADLQVYWSLHSFPLEDPNWQANPMGLWREAFVEITEHHCRMAKLHGSLKTAASSV